MTGPIEPHKAAPSPHPALARTLGPIAVLFLTLSATTPASSVFVIVPGMLRVAGSGALIAMLAAGLVCVATAFIYAELSAAWPNAGGEYVMVARTLGPLAGFVILGVNIVNNILFLPVAALGMGAVLARLVPGLPTIPVAIAVLLVSTALGLLNVRVNAIVTGLFLLVEMAALAGLAALGLLYPERALGQLLTAPLMPSGDGLAPASLAAIGTATTIAIFALNGYGMAVYFGEDMRDPRRRIAGVILAALGLTLLAEIAPVAAALVGTPDLGTFLVADDAFGLFAGQRGGARLGGWMAAGVGVAILNAAIVSVLAYARFLFATARDRVWGTTLDGLLGTLHPRFGSPTGATLAIGAVGIACCFVPIDLLLVTSGAGIVVSYAALSVATIMGRRSGATAHGGYRMPLYPLWPVMTVAMLGYIAWSNWQDLAEGRPGLIATAAEMLLAALYYLLVLRRRGAWTIADPRA